MDYRPYHTIIITSWDEIRVRAIHRLAKRYFPRVTAVAVSEFNHIYTFMIPTDGAKKGSERGAEAEKKRDAFWQLLDKRDCNGYQPVSAVEISFGKRASAVKVIRQLPRARDQ
jgi:hypothetical protein